MAQVIVGIANVLTGLPEGVTVLHSALAALLVLTLTATDAPVVRLPRVTVQDWPEMSR